jgi:hypothetical protein
LAEDARNRGAAVAIEAPPEKSADIRSDRSLEVPLARDTLVLSSEGSQRRAAMESSHIHPRNLGAQHRAVEDRRADEDREVIVSMKNAITQSQIPIDQSFVVIASTRDAIAFLDRLQSPQNSS